MRLLVVISITGALLFAAAFENPWTPALAFAVGLPVGYAVGRMSS